MYIPVATYRVQLHKAFNLQALDSIVVYLQQLGISTLYASPVLQSVPGSTHGYDAVDPDTINPEIGSLDELKALCARLRTMNIGWMQDIVPNHMALHTSNVILMDVLERGNQSPFYHYFDINWSHPSGDLAGKLMLPVLSKTLEESVGDGNVQLTLTESGIALSCNDQPYPLSMPAVLFLLQLPSFKNIEDVAINKWTAALEGQSIVPLEQWTADKQALFKNVANGILQNLQSVIDEVNAQPTLLQQVLDKNFYRLVLPQRVTAQINYRRFFTVNELICLSMELPEVFDHYHQLIAHLVKENCFQALRIDHIDGLKDPLQYLKRLRELAGEDCYIVTEKILSPTEAVPEDWPQQGTTGYDFLRIVNRVFIKPAQLQQLKEYYFHLFPDQDDYEQQAADCKQLVLEKYMKGELNNLTDALLRLPGMEQTHREKIQAALGLLMVAMPCYRIYPQAFPLSAQEVIILQTAFTRARELNADAAGLSMLEKLFLHTNTNEKDNEKVLGFLKRMMQFTGPLTAKGVEDTLFYRYAVLLSHNEVGDHPSGETIAPAQFHEQMKMRLQHNPFAMNATATHDTKRGEDARIRINCLAWIFNRWKSCTKKWMREHDQYTTVVNGWRAPAASDEYFIYQSIVGGLPPNAQITTGWQERLCEYIVKALREAKRNSLWEQPNVDYEEACTQFMHAICNDSHFTGEIAELMQELDRYAHVFSLGQLVLKMTAPGVPDIYQGCERWDYSFVDPDNRRPVDYATLSQWLVDIRNLGQLRKGSLAFSQEQWLEGLPKLFVTHKMLQLRQAYKNLFHSGEYIPLAVEGNKDEVIAYARRLADTWILVIVPLQLPEQFPATATLQLPATGCAVWRNVFSGKEIRSAEQLSIREMLEEFPVIVLESV